MLKTILKFNNYYLHPDKELARKVKSLLGFTPVNLGTFKLVFSHKSSASEKEYALSNNERLEFLGDAVLSSVVAEYLFQKYPNADEGFLTKMRSKIVKRQTLDQVGQKMRLDIFLEEFNSTRIVNSMLGNALEALLGAYYIEKGYEPTKNFIIQKVLRKYIDIHELERYDDNFKSQLLEWCQKNNKSIDYRVLARFKFDKRDKFKVAAVVDGKEVGVAEDFNKKSAEQLASYLTLLKMGLIDPEDSEVKEKWNFSFQNTLD